MGTTSPLDFDKLVLDSAAFFECLANFVPHSCYVPGCHGENPGKDVRRGRQKSIRRLLRYDPLSWRSCTSMIAASKQLTRQRKKEIDDKPHDLANASVTMPGFSKVESPTGPKALSRDELRKRLHDKIAALQAQQQKKKQKRLNAPDRRMKRRRLDDSTDSLKPSDFTFITVGESDPKKGSKRLVKRQKLNEALQQITKKEEERSNWSPEKKKQVELKEALSKAISRASGIKVYDDPKRLKKALKSREHKTLKSKSRWEERQKSAEEEKRERAMRRQQNINERIRKSKKA